MGQIRAASTPARQMSRPSLEVEASELDERTGPGSYGVKSDNHVSGHLLHWQRNNVSSGITGNIRRKLSS